MPSKTKEQPIDNDNSNTENPIPVSKKQPKRQTVEKEKKNKKEKKKSSKSKGDVQERENGKKKSKSKNKNKSKDTKDIPSSHGSKREKSKKALEKESKNQGTKRPHRFRSGTVATRQVKKQQKDPNLILQRTPFRRLVKLIVNDLDDKSEARFEHGTLDLIQTVVEDRTIDVLTNSTDVMAQMSKKKTLEPHHIKFTRSHHYRDLPTSVAE